ncbi:MAG: dGTPase, partial [Flavobacteriaceae bacterium]
NESSILKGEFQYSLLDKCKYEAQINDIIKISVEKIYQSQEVVEKEIAGYQVIADLLDVFITAVNHKHKNCPSNYDKLILMLLPDKYKNTPENLYKRILSICNLVANFSDSYAILLHKKIKGLDLG